MLIGTRARSASLAVAFLVTALVWAPAFAREQEAGGRDRVEALAKPSQKPKPSHPHATPTPAPTPTPRVTPAPTPKITPKPPNATPRPDPDPTPRTTDRPRQDAATPKPTKRPRANAASPSASAAATPSPTLAPGANVGGAGAARSTGPSPELLAVAASLAAVVGLGTLWFLTRGRRRRPLVPRPVAARVEAAPPVSGWTNLSLDDNDGLPSWLRSLSESERDAAPAWELSRSAAPLPGAEAVPAAEPPLAGDPVARASHRFAEPVADGAIRLAIGGNGTELLDQPSELGGVVLATLVPGDEVEIQDLQEPWVRVLTPIGGTGWIRVTSLGMGSTAAEEPSKPRAAKRRGTSVPRRSRAPRPAT